MTETRYIAPDRRPEKMMNGAVAWLARRGVSLLGSRELHVVGRTSGEVRTTPVNLLDLDGEQYLVAPRGLAQWVRNIRVAGGGELTVGRRVQRFSIDEVADADKLPILREYLRRWGWEVGNFFEGVTKGATDEELMSIAPGFPVFRVVAVDAHPTAEQAATRAWSKRVRRVGGFIQVGFAALWLVRGAANVPGALGLVLAVVSAMAVIAAVLYGRRVTAGVAPRPVGTEAVRIQRSVTVATILQLAASFLLPAVVVAAGQPDWVLASVAVTIGPLLLWLDHRFDIPRYSVTGWALILGPVGLVAVMSGTALAATTGLTLGALLLATSTAGFRDLARIPRRPGTLVPSMAESA